MDNILVEKTNHSWKVTKRFPFFKHFNDAFLIVSCKAMKNFFLYFSYFEDLKETDSTCVNRRKKFNFQRLLLHMDFFLDTVITKTSYDAAVRHLNSFENTFLHFTLILSNKLRLNVCRKKNT